MSFSIRRKCEQLIGKKIAHVISLQISLAWILPLNNWHNASLGLSHVRLLKCMKNVNSQRKMLKIFQRFEAVAIRMYFTIDVAYFLNIVFHSYHNNVPYINCPSNTLKDIYLLLMQISCNILLNHSISFHFIFRLRRMLNSYSKFKVRDNYSLNWLWRKFEKQLIDWVYSRH